MDTTLYVDADNKIRRALIAESNRQREKVA